MLEEDKRIKRIVLIISLLICLVLSYCSNPYDFFIPEGSSSHAALRDLFSLLERYQKPSQSKERFVIIRQILDYLGRVEAEDKKIVLLNYLTEKFPQDIYNAYYTAVIAQSYRRLNQDPLAIYFYRKAVVKYPDLFFNGEYIHKFCLEELCSLLADPHEQIYYSHLLLERFGEGINRAQVFYNLARSFEKIGDYPQACDFYRRLLVEPSASKLSTTNLREVKERLLRYESKPTWVLRDLNDLVTRIKLALEEKDLESLLRYQAKSYFFSLTWEQRKDPLLTDNQSALNIGNYLGSFLLKSNVKVAANLDLSSTANEAYLKTENWAFHVHTTWYFYFRKIEFGPDPEINGGWEWAGIFLGERL